MKTLNKDYSFCSGNGCRREANITTLKIKVMIVSGCIFQKRNIKANTENYFEATYKKKRFIITTNHGFGEPKFKHLKRFNIDVIDIPTGMHDVQSYEDFHDIKDAIRYALVGACLTE